MSPPAGAPSGEAWRPCLFKGGRVLARSDDAGRLIADEHGLVEMVYRPGGKIYRAARKNLEPLAGEGALPGLGLEPAPASVAAPAGARSGPAPAGRGARPVAAPAGQPRFRVRVVGWTDGASLGNPGPTGAGVLLRRQSGTREVSRFLGRGTNNIGELTAVRIALELVEDPEAEIVLHTDSEYTLGVLTRPWKPKKNVELIAEIKRLMASFASVQLRKVPGHAGVPENERVDWLARRAAQTGRDLDLSLPGEEGTGEPVRRQHDE